MATRQELIDSFQNTFSMCVSNEKLHNAILNSTSKSLIYKETYTPMITVHGKTTRVIISGRRSFEAAKRYVGHKVAVLNFASATHPGGGVMHGSRAQEESLCRSSTLFPVLNNEKFWDEFYGYHRHKHDPLSTNRLIYSPDIVVFKDDSLVPILLPESEWFQVDVITSAAPNLRTDIAPVILDKELLEIHKSRARHIIKVAASYGVEVLILGAFGCGAFKNNPQVVAQAYKEVLCELDGLIPTVEFAVYCPPRDKTNYNVFSEVLQNGSYSTEH